MKYRFKTEKEFIEEFGHNWRPIVGWNCSGQMEYLLGSDFPYLFKNENQTISIKDKNSRNYWSIDNNMVTLKLPNYNNKPKINRVL